MSLFNLYMRFLKPETAGKRSRLVLRKFFLSKIPVVKKKIQGRKCSSGRNNSGKITVFHKGSGNKKRYRTLEFIRYFSSDGVVTSLEHDPYRSAFIASIFDRSSKDFFYITAPRNLRVGDIVRSGSQIIPKLGYCLPLSRIPIGSYIHNVPSNLHSNAKFARSAGSFCVLKEKLSESALLSLKSGELREVPLKCHVSIGIVSNQFHFIVRKSKAGQSRWLNRRPTVRGVAMNPVDHPHGGGEGKKSAKGLTPWGKLVKQGKTSRSRNPFISKAK